MVQVLLDAGASRAAVDLAKMTPLHHACLANAESCVSRLIQGNEVCIDAKDISGCTPLIYCLNNKNSGLEKVRETHTTCTHRHTYIHHSPTHTAVSVSWCLSYRRFGRRLLYVLLSHTPKDLTSSINNSTLPLSLSLSRLCLCYYVLSLCYQSRVCILHTYA